MTKPQTRKGFTTLVLSVFRLNGRLLAAGDELCRDLNLTSARWQVIGGIEEAALPVAHIARNMGLTRQAVQRIANDLAAEGFVVYEDNPHHRRAKLVKLTEKGRASLKVINRRQAEWSDRLTEGLTGQAIESATKVISHLTHRIQVRDLGRSEKN